MTNQPPAIIAPSFTSNIRNTNAVNGIIASEVSIPVPLNPTITTRHILIAQGVTKSNTPWVISGPLCWYYYVEITNLGVGNFGIAASSTPFLKWSLTDSNTLAAGFPIGDLGNFNWSSYSNNVWRGLFMNESAYFCAYGIGAGLFVTNTTLNVDTNNVLVTNSIVTLSSNGVYTIDEQMFSDSLGYYLQPLSYYFTNSTGVTNWVAPDSSVYELFYNPYLTTNITKQTN